MTASAKHRYSGDQAERSAGATTVAVAGRLAHMAVLSEHRL
ncbi:MAG TPA: hypothetical protein VGL93_11275 [Streptosporangiaceae bacterium]